MNENDGAYQLIPPSDEQEHIRFARLLVSGMYCATCAVRIHDKLVMLDGVLKAQVDQLAGVADVIFDSNFITLPSLIRAVIQAGDEDRFTYQAVAATTAGSNPLSNTLTRPSRRPHKVRPR